MQTPKARAGTSEVPKKKSPVTPRTPRQLKTPGSDSDLTSLNPPSRSPKDRSPANKTPKDRRSKVIERSSPRSPISEKKRPIRVQELESQVTQRHEDLKRAKEQLSTSESWKRKAEQEAEEAKKQVLAMSKKLEESQQQLLDLSASEEERLQELRKISQDRDRAWQSELEAIQKQHSMDSSALVSAMNEIQKLKIQLGRVSESEATQTNNAESAHDEIQDLKMELAGTLSLVEKLKYELRDCKESESRALEVLGKTQIQLQTANEAVETLQLDGVKAMEDYRSLAVELDQSRAHVKSLEGLVNKLQADLVNSVNETGLAMENGDTQEISQLKAQLVSAKSEVGQLRSALEVAEVRYQEEYIQSTLQIRSTYEQLELTKSESCHREAKLQEELQRAKADFLELKASLMDKESQLQSISEENEGLNLWIKQIQPSESESQLVMELKKLESDVAELKARVSDRESELQNMAEENNALKMEIKKGEMENNKDTEEALASAEAARVAEREALMKLGYVTEEADKSNRRVARVTEQLDAAQAANSELEAELRRLKVQSDQWRKAAEAAAAMLSPGNNGKLVERTGSLDSSYNSIAGKMSSPYSEDTDFDDSPKKKNTNMLKRIGVLWKKKY